jgi:hypothetical protein
MGFPDWAIDTNYTIPVPLYFIFFPKRKFFPELPEIAGKCENWDS